MTSLLRKISVLTLFVLLLGAFSAYSAPADFLSADDIAWLKAHPVIRIAPDPDAAPVEWIDNNGRYRGMSANYMALIAKKLGISFQTVGAENWTEVLDQAKSHQIDVIPSIAFSPQREKYLSFTAPYLLIPGVVISSHDYRNIKELQGKRVAVVVDYVWDDFLTHHSVDVVLVRVEDTKTALDLTAMGAVDAMVSDLATATDAIQKNGITNLRIVKYLDRKLELSIGVRRDWPELTTILNKALATITPLQRESINKRWFKIIDIPWWRDPHIQTVGLSVMTAFMLFVIAIVVWNRQLSRQVQKRTEALQLAQRQLIQAAKMESVGQLAAGVAHEVKNPLAIIRMGIEFLAGGKQVDDTERDVLTDMEDAVQRADTVIRDLLDFSRDKELCLSSADVNEVIRKALHMVGHELRKRNIRIETSFASLPQLPIDPGKLQQVFINLFTNSAHAIETDGFIKVSTQHHRITAAEAAELSANHCQPGSAAVRIEIIDDGCGIDEKKGDKIFDPFYTTKDVGQGTGLGLSVSRNIIELHNGLLTLENCPAGGACATIVIPWNKGD